MSPNPTVHQLLTGKRKRNITSNIGKSAFHVRCGGKRSSSPRPSSTSMSYNNGNSNSNSNSRHRIHQQTHDQSIIGGVVEHSRHLVPVSSVERTTTTTAAKVTPSLPRNEHMQKQHQQPKATTKSPHCHSVDEKMLQAAAPSSPPTATATVTAANDKEREKVESHSPTSPQKMPPSPILAVLERTSIDTEMSELVAVTHASGSPPTTTVTKVAAVDNSDRIKGQQQPESQLQLQCEENKSRINDDNDDKNVSESKDDTPPQQCCQQQQQPRLYNRRRNRRSRCYIRYKKGRWQTEKNENDGVFGNGRYGRMKQRHYGDDYDNGRTQQLEATVARRRRQKQCQRQRQRHMGTNTVVVAQNLTKKSKENSSEPLIRSLLGKIRERNIATFSTSSSSISLFDDPTVFPFILLGVCVISRISDWLHQKRKEEALLTSPEVHAIVLMMDQRQSQAEIDINWERKKRFAAEQQVEQQEIQSKIIMESITRRNRDLLSQQAKFEESIDDGHEESLRLLSRQQRQQQDEGEAKQLQKGEETVGPLSSTISMYDHHQQQQLISEPQAVAVAVAAIEITVAPTQKVAPGLPRNASQTKSLISKSNISNSSSINNNNNGDKCDNMDNIKIPKHAVDDDYDNNDSNNAGGVIPNTDGNNGTRQDDKEVVSQDFFILRRTKKQESQQQQQQQQQSQKINSDTDIVITDAHRFKKQQELQYQLPESEKLVLEEEFGHNQKDNHRNRDSTNSRVQLDLHGDHNLNQLKEQYEEPLRSSKPVLLGKSTKRKRKIEEEESDNDNYSYPDDFPNSLPRTVITYLNSHGKTSLSSILPDYTERRRNFDSQQRANIDFPSEEEDCDDYYDNEEYDGGGDNDDHLMTSMMKLKSPTPQPLQTKLIREKVQRQKHTRETKITTKAWDNGNNDNIHSSNDGDPVTDMLHREIKSKNDIRTGDTKVLPSGRLIIANPDGVRSTDIALPSAAPSKVPPTGTTTTTTTIRGDTHTGTRADTQGSRREKTPIGITTSTPHPDTPVSGRENTPEGIRTNASHPIKPYSRNEVTHQTDDKVSRDDNKKMRLIDPEKLTKVDPTYHSPSMQRPVPNRQHEDMYNSMNGEYKEGKNYVDRSTGREVSRNSQTDASELLLSQSQRVAPQKARRVTVSPRSLPNSKQSREQYQEQYHSNRNFPARNLKGDRGAKPKDNNKNKGKKSSSSTQNGWVSKVSRRSPCLKQTSIFSTNGNTGWVSNQPARNFVNNRNSPSTIPEKKSAASRVTKRNSPIFPENVAAAAKTSLFRSHGKENSNQKDDNFRGERSGGTRTTRIDRKKLDRNDDVDSVEHKKDDDDDKNSDFVRGKDDRKAASRKTPMSEVIRSKIISVPEEKKYTAPPVGKRQTEVQVKRDSKSDSDSDSDDDEADNFKYEDVVRGKSARAALNGYQCAECGIFFDAIFDGEGANHFNRSDFVACSRHRGRQSPPQTPVDYWELSFIDERDKKNTTGSCGT